MLIIILIIYQYDSVIPFSEMLLKFILYERTLLFMD